MPQPLIPFGLFGNARPPLDAGSTPEPSGLPFAQVLGERLQPQTAPQAPKAAAEPAATFTEMNSAPLAANTPAEATSDHGESAAKTIDPALAAWLEQIVPPQAAATSAGPTPANNDTAPAISAAQPISVARQPEDEDGENARNGEPETVKDASEAVADAAADVLAVPATPFAPTTPLGTSRNAGNATARTTPAGPAIVMAAPVAASAGTAGEALQSSVPAVGAEVAVDAPTTRLPEVTADTAATTAEPSDDFARLVERAGATASGTTTGTPTPTAAAHGSRHAEALPTQHAAGTPAWQSEVGDRMVWMANTQRAQADLVLNPPQLGRIEVSLTVAGDQASAVFGSPNATVREMIENSLPRLREILAGAGIDLGQADVNAGTTGQSGQDGERRSGDNRSGDASMVATGAMRLDGTNGASWTRGGNALVDTFA